MLYGTAPGRTFEVQSSRQVKTRCVILRAEWGKSRKPDSAADCSAEKRLVPGPARGVSLAFFLRTDRTEHHVFRAAVLSIVLTLAVGPNAALLCRTWCDQQVATASRCHHETSTTSPNVAGDDSCDSSVLSAAFLREDVRRGVSPPDGDQAIPIPRYQVACSTIDARPGHEPGREWSLEKRPLSTALRI